MAGRLYKRNGVRLTTKCPGCAGDLIVAGQTFQCLNSSCEFGRGSAFDYLAAIFGSYQEAVEVASQDFPVLMTHQEEYVGQLERSRRLLNFFLEAERTNADTERDRMLLKHQFHRELGIDPANFPKGHWFLTGQQAASLLLLLLEMEIEPPRNLHDRPVVIAPFWKDRHSIASFTVLSPDRGYAKVVEIEPIRVGWFGISDMHPLNRRAVIFPDYPQALAAYEYYKTLEDDWFPTSVRIQTKCTDYGLQFDEILFRANDDEWLAHLPSWSYVPGFDDARFQTGLLGAKETLFELMTRLFHANRRQPAHFLDLCSAMRLNNPLRAHLTGLSYTMGDLKGAAALRNTLSRVILDMDEKGHIYECADGYYTEVKGRSVQATNFTFQFERRIHFESNADIWASGHFHIGTARIPFEVNTKQLENNREIGPMLVSAQLSNMPEMDSMTPSIIKVNEYKRAVATLKPKIDQLPIYEGITNLGWNRRHDVFLLPNAQVRAQGIGHRVVFRPPLQSDFDCFAPIEHNCWELPQEMPEISPQLAELLSAIVAQVLRVYNGRRVMLWPIRNNSGKEKAVQLFSGIGQTSLVRLSSVLTRHLSVNRGLPCAVVVPNEQQFKNLELAGIGVSEKYQTDLETISDHEIELAAALIPALIATTSLRLLNKDRASYIERRNVRPVFGMAAEGAAFIQACFWKSWPEAGSKWKALNTLLDRKEQQIPREIRVNVNADTIWLPQTLWADMDDVDADDLKIDLGSMSLLTRIEEDGLVVNRSSMNKIFSDFYGQVPEELTVV